MEQRQRRAVETDGEVPLSDHWWTPRPDLTADDQQWQALLWAAYRQDGEQADGLFGSLHMLRCCGARIIQRDNGTYKLVAGLDYDGAWQDNCQRWLAPHVATLRSLLTHLTASPR